MIRLESTSFVTGQITICGHDQNNLSKSLGSKCRNQLSSKHCNLGMADPNPSTRASFHGTFQPQRSNLERAGEDEPNRVCSKLVRHKPRADEKACRGRDGRDRAGLGGAQGEARRRSGHGANLGCCSAWGRRRRTQRTPSRIRSPRCCSDSPSYSRQYESWKL